MTSQLSYQDKKGYYGLTVEPTYEEMLRSLKKQIRIPQPDRSAKWYATSIYRSYLLEQARRYHDSERKNLEYDESGAHLPRAAAHHTSGSMAGTDDTWDRQVEYNSNLDLEEARKLAQEGMAQERKASANQVRKQQLSSYGLVAGHWTVDAHHEDLEYKGIPHAAPMPKMTMPAGRWAAPPQEYAAAGIPQAPEFPTYEELNLGQDKRFKQGKPAPVEVNKNYQQLRNNYLA